MQILSKENHPVVALKSISSATPHLCRANNSPSDRCQFCNICGVYISGENNTSVYVRSERFTGKDLYLANSNNILEQMILKQSNNRYFNVQAHNLNQRLEMVEWMQAVCEKMEYSLSTFYFAVSYLDAIFSLYVIQESQLQLIAFMSIIMAAKMEESESKIPTIRQSARMCGGDTKEQDIVNCENFIFKILGYNLSVKTPFQFLVFFFSKGFMLKSELNFLVLSATESKSMNVIQGDLEDQCICKVEKVALFFIDHSIKQYEFYRFTSVAIAATAISCARKCMGLSSWSEDLERLTCVSRQAINECREIMVESFRTSHPEKYSQFFPQNRTPPHTKRNFSHSLNFSENPKTPFKELISVSISTYSIERKTEEPSNPTKSRENKEVLSTVQNQRTSGSNDETGETRLPLTRLDFNIKIREFEWESAAEEEIKERPYNESQKLFGADLNNIYVNKEGRN
jgi:hypothetical protein